VIVVDTNVMIYLLGDGPHAPAASALLLRDPDWAAPLILLSELRNVLVGSVRRGLVGATDALAMYEDGRHLLADRIPAVDGAATMDVALDSGLSAYDAEFVVSARALGLPLVTADRRIIEAAPDVAIPLSDFNP